MIPICSLYGFSLGIYVALILGTEPLPFALIGFSLGIYAGLLFSRRRVK